MSPAYQGSNTFSPVEENMLHALLTKGRTNWTSCYRRSTNYYEFFTCEGCLDAIDEIATMKGMDQLEGRIIELKRELLQQGADNLPSYLEQLERYRVERATAQDAEVLVMYGKLALMNNVYTFINTARVAQATIPPPSSPSRTHTPPSRQSRRNRQR